MFKVKKVMNLQVISCAKTFEKKMLPDALIKNRLLHVGSRGSRVHQVYIGKSNWMVEAVFLTL